LNELIIKLLGVDHLVITGDITNIAMEEEFQKAASLIREISGKIPTSIIPGNHDIYTFGCPKRKLFQKVEFFLSFFLNFNELILFYFQKIY